MIKRIFDISCSVIGILILSPFLLIICILIAIDSHGGIFYRQSRVGKNNKDFMLLKFRTMRPGSDKQGLLTVGSRDARITGIGYFLRKIKFDELPQLINVLKGDMSLVGPRPEVRKYVELYTEEQKKVLTVRPGITDLASIEYINENDVLARAADAEQVYIHEIMPHKLKLGLKYIEEQSFFTDLGIILKTIFKMIK